MELKKPKGGVFINEDELADCDNLHSQHDPREAQQYLKNKKNSQYLVTEENGQLYATVESKRKPMKKKNAKATQVEFDFQQIVRGNSHILQVCKEARGWHALSVVTTAFIYSKMTEPRFWSRETVDEIINAGLSFSNTWKEPASDRVLEGLPSTFDFKGYRVQIELEPCCDEGVLYPALTYVCSDLCRSLTSLFNYDTKSKGVLIEIEHFVLIVWRKDDLYCLFDPFERDELGHDTSNGFACVLLNNRLSEICRTIYNNISTFLVPTHNYSLSVIVVKQIDKLMYANIFKDPPIQVDEIKQRSMISHATSKMCIPVMPIGVSSVPMSELSDLSLVGMRKKRKAVKVASKVSLTRNVDTNPTDKCNMGHKDTLGLNLVMNEHEIEATLDGVLDRVQDKIDAKCYKGFAIKVYLKIYL